MPFMQDFSSTAKKLLEEASHAAAQARRTAGELTEANRDKIDAAIEKTSRLVDGKTAGKYGATIAKAKGAAGKGVDFVAKQKSTPVPPRPAGEHDGSDVPRTAPPTETPWMGGSATWQDDSIQDTVQGSSTDGPATDGPATDGPAAGYPDPIPPYTPPTY